MTDAQLLSEAIEALAEAASEEQPIKFGHEVARVLHAALAQATLPPPVPEHEHAWLALGWDRPGGGHAKVVQQCTCGEIREQEAS